MLINISTLFDFYNQYHDRSVVDDLYKVAKNELDIALTTVNEKYLVDPSNKWFIFVDWNMNFDRDTCGQAILIYALHQFIELAKVEKDEKSIEKYSTVLANLINAAKENLYDKALGLFVSGKNKEINLASQVWMAIAHVLSERDNEYLMQETIKRFFPIYNIKTPYMYHFIEVALFETSHKSEAIDLMKSYWGKMIDYGADTFWEVFDPDNPGISPYDSLAVTSFCHGWSCTPVYLIRKYITHTIK